MITLYPVWIHQWTSRGIHCTLVLRAINNKPGPSIKNLFKLPASSPFLKFKIWMQTLSILFNLFKDTITVKKANALKRSLERAKNCNVGLTSPSNFNFKLRFNWLINPININYRSCINAMTPLLTITTGL